MHGTVVEIEDVAERSQSENPVMRFDIGKHRFDRMSDRRKETPHDVHNRIPSRKPFRAQPSIVGRCAGSGGVARGNCGCAKTLRSLMSGAPPRRTPHEPCMPSPFEGAPAARAIPITFATKSTWEAIAAALPAQARQFARANGFAGKPGACLTLPAADGAIAQVLFGIEDEAAKSRDLFRPGALPGLLPAGTYRFANAPHDTRLAALAFALGCYRFNRYRKGDAADVKLVPPGGVDTVDVARMADAAMFARDLVNTPSNDMGPAELEGAARALAERY